MQIIRKAMALAEKAHSGQEYAGKSYMVHLHAAAEAAEDVYWEAGSGLNIEYLVAACYLHDIIEDTHVSAEDLISHGFPVEIVEAVKCVTKEEGYDYQQYIERILQNPLAKAVKVADTLANLTQSLKTGNKRFLKKYTKQLCLLGGVVE